MDEQLEEDVKEVMVTEGPVVGDGGESSEERRENPVELFFRG